MKHIWKFLAVIAAVLAVVSCDAAKKTDDAAEFTKATGVYTYTLPIAQIATAWGGTTVSPAFSVLFMTDAQATLANSEAWKNDNWAKTADITAPVYQVAACGNSKIKSTATAASYNVYGSEPQNYAYVVYTGVVATVDATTFTLTVDASKIERKALKILAGGKETVATDEMVVNMKGMKPYVIALNSKANDATNFVANGWGGDLMKMTTVTTAIPTGKDDFPPVYTFEDLDTCVGSVTDPAWNTAAKNMSALADGKRTFEYKAAAAGTIQFKFCNSTAGWDYQAGPAKDTTLTAFGETIALKTSSNAGSISATAEAGVTYVITLKDITKAGANVVVTKK